MIDHMRPHLSVIDQEGPGLSGLIHKEAHPVVPDLISNDFLKALMLGASTAL